MAEPATSTAAVIASAPACRSAGYPGPFQAEGIAFAQWMDDCNATGYQVMSEVESGARGPLSVAEYIDLLPILELP